MNISLIRGGLAVLSAAAVLHSQAAGITMPVRSKVFKPQVRKTFRQGSRWRARKQGGNPRTVNGCFVFDGAKDGDRQVDPQIAVGGGYVVHATNNGLLIYDKQGNYVDSCSMWCYGGGIDPKLFFDVNNRVFGFDVWLYWDKAKVKPINISISHTDNPLGAWSTYSIPSPDEKDGGALGQSDKWVAYSFPSNKERLLAFRMEDARLGRPARVYFFTQPAGVPAVTLDKRDDLYFLKINGKNFVISRLFDRGDGTPALEVTAKKPHGLKYTGSPPRAAQKGSQITVAAGDRNPKNLVLMNGFLWFSDTVNVNGRAAVQWVQLKLDGTVVQHGLISSDKNSYIQTTLAVNRRNDVLVGFQEVGPDMYISPRMAWRLAGDPPGKLRGIVSLGEGQGAIGGAAWGDYSGSSVDGDNLLDLWTVQSLASEKGRGPVVIAKAPLPGATPKSVKEKKAGTE